MRALVPLAVLCLSACGSAEPDPPPVDPAVLAAERRAQNDAIIRARRAELAKQRAARQQERSVKTREQQLKDVLDQSRRENERWANENYQECLRRYPEKPSTCSTLRPRPAP